MNIIFWALQALLASTTFAVSPRPMSTDSIETVNQQVNIHKPEHGAGAPLPDSTPHELGERIANNTYSHGTNEGNVRVIQGSMKGSPVIESTASVPTLAVMNDSNPMEQDINGGPGNVTGDNPEDRSLHSLRRHGGWLAAAALLLHAVQSNSKPTTQVTTSGDAQPPPPRMGYVQVPQQETIRYVQAPPENVRYVQAPQEQAVSYVSVPQQENVRYVEAPQQQAVSYVAAPQQETVRFVEAPQQQAVSYVAAPQQETVVYVQAPQQQAVSYVEATQQQAPVSYEEASQQHQPVIYYVQAPPEQVPVTNVQGPEKSNQDTSSGISGFFKMRIVQDAGEDE